MLLIRTWSKEARLAYDLVRDGLSGEQPIDHAQRVVEAPWIEFPAPVMAEQMAFVRVLRKLGKEIALRQAEE